jgi:hypothetical protein
MLPDARWVRRVCLGVVALAVALADLLAGRADAQHVTGATHATVGSGLRMAVDTRWMAGGGYRPVLIEVTPIVPSQQDQTLTVDFYSRCQYNSRRTLITGRDIEIPAGANSVTAMLYVPESTPAHTYDMDVAVDGRLSKGLSFKAGVGLATFNNAWQGLLPAVLFIGQTVPDTSQMAVVLPGLQYYQQYTSGWNVAQAGGQTAQSALPTAFHAAFARLPDDWLGYSNADVACLSLDDALSLAEQLPRKFQALRGWALTGGNLFVHGVGADGERLAELERLLGLDAVAGESAVERWTAPQTRHFSRIVDDPQIESYEQVARYDAAGNLIQPPQVEAGNNVAPEKPHFVTRTMGLGMVVAFSGDPFPGTPEQWGWVWNHVGHQRYLWPRRHGIAMEGENPDFWNWMIPNVGLAPVNGFRVLITLFVIAIGPVNYYLLWRSGRRHLLVVVVPLCALAITAGLFGYAVLADGLGVRARVRSFTSLDQRNQEAACWSRISYYAGLAPSGGLMFPADVAVLPISALGPTEDDTRHRQLDWTSGGQRLASGWLSARILTQYATVRMRKTGVELRLLPGAAGAGGAEPPRVENRLQTRIHHLLLKADDGGLYRGANLAPGDTATLDVADAERDLAALKAVIRSNVPAIPDSFDPSDTRGFSFFGISRRLYYPYGGDDASMSTGRLERAIAEVTGLPIDALPPRSYIAIVERSPEVSLGVERVEEQGSLHVIVGRW